VTSCSTGTCQLTGCSTGFANCDNNATNGCEVNTNTSATNCGGCGLACSTVHGTPSCNNATCSIVCAGGYGNCDGNVANGCEAEFASNTNNCGSCGTVCNNTNGSPTCTTGVCGISCNSGFGNCDNNASNGCETTTSSSLAHCGTCNHACNSTNGSATCVNSTCGIICTPGFGNCDNNVDNGCEAVFASDPLHCGSCSGLCNLANAVEGCSGGACTIASCNPNWGNCDGTVSNGCETPTSADVLNCGACNNVCGQANGTRSCDAGVCKIACSVGYGNCDNVNSNGCETSTNTDVNNCGGCGTVCPAIPNGTAGCLVGVCGVASCNSGYHLDNGQCLSNSEICTGGVDEDGDGRIDCFDSDCDTNAACNGYCRDAETIACDTFVAGKNTGAAGSTQHIAPPAYSCTSTSYPGPERAFKFTGAAGQDVVAEIYGVGGNLALFAINPATGAQCNAMTSCATYGDALTSTNAEALAFTAAAGKDYYLVVDGPAAANFSMTVQCIPSGGCSPAVAIQSGQSFLSSNVGGSGPNVTSNITHHQPFSGSGWTGPEAAYVFTPTATASYTVSIVGNPLANKLDCDADLFVKQASTGCGQETLAYSATIGTKPETITFNGVANTTYFIVVDGFLDGGVGCETDYFISITSP